MESSNKPAGVGKTVENAEAPLNPDAELPQLNENDAEEVFVLEETDNSPLQDEDDDESAYRNGQVEADVLDDEHHESDADDVSPSEPYHDDAILVLREHTDETLAVAASPSNPNIVISGSMDDIGKIWDIELGTSIAQVDGAKESISVVSFSHDGKYAAFGSENGAISIVFMDGSPAPGEPLDGPGDAISFLSWHPRGPVLLAGSADSVAYMWNAPKGKFMMAFAGHEDAITCGGFTNDGKFVVTGSLDASVRVWSPTGGETVVRIQIGVPGMRGSFHSADLQCLAVGSAGTSASMLIASGCGAGDVYVTHRESGQVITQLPQHEDGVECVSFSPKGMRSVFLATAGSDGVVRVWDIEKSVERCKFTHGGVVVKVVWHKTQPVLASASSDGSVVLWDVLKVVQIRRYTGHESFISDICYARNGECIATTSGDGSVRIYDIRDALSKV